MTRRRYESAPPALAFDLEPGHVLDGRYVVVGPLGAGWEGEVYRVRERRTRIERAAKLFYPQRNRGDRVASTYARKLHKLRRCEVLIRYHGRCEVEVADQEVTCLISECVEGELLSGFLARQPGQMLSPFQAVHLLYALVCGMEAIHHQGEYHGDLHKENVILQGVGLTFELKLLDLYTQPGSSAENRREDIVDLVRIFYESLGGRRTYSRQPQEVKEIVRGMRRKLILERFRNIWDLRYHLEELRWE